MPLVRVDEEVHAMLMELKRKMNAPSLNYVIKKLIKQYSFSDIASVLKMDPRKLAKERCAHVEGDLWEIESHFDEVFQTLKKEQVLAWGDLVIILVPPDHRAIAVYDSKPYPLEEFSYKVKEATEKKGDIEIKWKIYFIREDVFKFIDIIISRHGLLGAKRLNKRTMKFEEL